MARKGLALALILPPCLGLLTPLVQAGTVRLLPHETGDAAWFIEITPPLLPTETAAVLLDDAPDGAPPEPAFQTIVSSTDKEATVLLLRGQRPSPTSEPMLRIRIPGRPEQTIPLPSRLPARIGHPVDVAVVVDDSFSMRDSDPEGLRIKAIPSFHEDASALGSIHSLCVVAFSRFPRLLQPPTPPEELGDLDLLARQLRSAGRTNMDRALAFALRTLAKSPSRRKVVVFLSDGYNSPGAYAEGHRLFQLAGWPIHTIGLSPKVDRDTLERMAKETGGRFHYCPDAASLSEAFANAARMLDRPLQVTRWLMTPTTSNARVANTLLDDSMVSARWHWMASDAETVPTIERPDGTLCRLLPGHQSLDLRRPPPGIWNVRFPQKGYGLLHVLGEGEFDLLLFPPRMRDHELFVAGFMESDSSLADLATGEARWISGGQMQTAPLAFENREAGLYMHATLPLNRAPKQGTERAAGHPELLSETSLIVRIPKRNIERSASVFLSRIRPVLPQPGQGAAADRTLFDPAPLPAWPWKRLLPQAKRQFPSTADLAPQPTRPSIGRHTTSPTKHIREVANPSRRMSAAGTGSPPMLRREMPPRQAADPMAPARSAPRNGFRIFLALLLLVLALLLILRLLQSLRGPHLLPYLMVSLLAHGLLFLLAVNLLMESGVVEMEQIAPALAVRIRSLEQRLGVEFLPPPREIAVSEVWRDVEAPRAQGDSFSEPVQRITDEIMPSGQMTRQPAATPPELVSPVNDLAAIRPEFLTVTEAKLLHPPEIEPSTPTPAPVHAAASGPPRDAPMRTVPAQRPKTSAESSLASATPSAATRQPSLPVGETSRSPAPAEPVSLAAAQPAPRRPLSAPEPDAPALNIPGDNVFVAATPTPAPVHADASGTPRDAPMRTVPAQRPKTSAESSLASATPSAATRQPSLPVGETSRSPAPAEPVSLAAAQPAPRRPLSAPEPDAPALNIPGDNVFVAATPTPAPVHADASGTPRDAPMRTVPAQRPNAPAPFGPTPFVPRMTKPPPEPTAMLSRSRPSVPPPGTPAAQPRRDSGASFDTDLGNGRPVASLPVSLGMAVYAGDWNSSPTAMLFLGHQLEQRSGMAFSASSRPVELDNPALNDLAFVYLTGHQNFVFSDAEIESLRRYLHQGGHLWIDDSTHFDDNRFDTAVRRELARLLPGKSIDRLPSDFEALFMGYDLRDGYRGYSIPPGDKYRLDYLEGIRLGDRVAVVYTRNDYGDGLNIDPHTFPIMESLTDLSPAEMQEGAVRMGINLVLYFLSNRMESTARLTQTRVTLRDTDAPLHPLVPEGEVEKLDVLADPHRWTVETWGDPATLSRMNGLRIAFEKGAKAKNAITYAFDAPRSVARTQFLVVEAESHLHSGARLALGLSAKDEYFESRPFFLKPGKNTAVFPLGETAFKSRQTDWEYRGTLPERLALDRLTLLLYAPQSGRVTIDSMRILSPQNGN